MLQSPETKRDAAGAWIFDWPGNRLKACLVQAGRTVMVWVAGSLEEINALRATSAALSQPLPTERRGLARVADAARASGPINAVGLVCYMVLLSGLFLTLVTWAGAVAADGGPRLAGDALAARLLAVSYLDAPITVSKGERDDDLVADWKYADAQWLHHAGAGGMRGLHRLLLRLDRSHWLVRCREFHAETAWSAGMDAGGIQWHHLLPLSARALLRPAHWTEWQAHSRAAIHLYVRRSRDEKSDHRRDQGERLEMAARFLLRSVVAYPATWMTSGTDRNSPLNTKRSQ